MKCTKCGMDKQMSAFSTNGAGAIKKRCKPCRSSDQSARYAATPLEQRRLARRRISEWVKRNPEKYRGYAKRTRAANPELYRSKVNRRRKRHRQATPLWADRVAMAAIYRKSVQMSISTGVPHEVDHIVP